MAAILWKVVMHFGRKIKVIIATLGEGDLFLSEMNETLQVIFQ